MTALIILFAVLNALDGYSTWHILRFGGRELNKPLAWLMEVLGRYWALVLVKVFPVLVVWYLSFNGLSWKVLAVICIAYSVVVVSNFYQLQKHK